MRPSTIARLERHFLGCSAAASAAIGVAPDPAGASIIYSGPLMMTIPSTINGLYLNIVTGAINEPGNTPGSTVPGWDVNLYGSTSLACFNPSNMPGGAYVIGGGAGTSPANLPIASIVGPAASYGSGPASTTGSNPFLLNSGNNLIGFRFVHEGNGNTIHYGWMRVALAGSLQAQPRYLVEYCWEDTPGAPISAGAFPAPGGLALLALGAAGVGSRRRRSLRR